MIWNETKECMSRDEMHKLQSARLVKLVDYVYHNVEYYRKKMQARPRRGCLAFYHHAGRRPVADLVLRFCRLAFKRFIR